MRGLTEAHEEDGEGLRLGCRRRIRRAGLRSHPLRRRRRRESEARVSSVVGTGTGD